MERPYRSYDVVQFTKLVDAYSGYVLPGGDSFAALIRLSNLMSPLESICENLGGIDLSSGEPLAVLQDTNSDVAHTESQPCIGRVSVYCVGSSSVINTVTRLEQGIGRVQLKTVIVGPLETNLDVVAAFAAHYEQKPHPLRPTRRYIRSLEPVSAPEEVKP